MTAITFLGWTFVITIFLAIVGIALLFPARYAQQTKDRTTETNLLIAAAFFLVPALILLLPTIILLFLALFTTVLPKAFRK